MRFTFPKKEINHQHLLSWRNSIFANQKYISEAESILRNLIQHYPLLKNLYKTPNLLPSHLETPFLSDRLLQIITIIIALSKEKSLFNIEEFIAEKHLYKDWHILEHTLRENQATFIALSTIHCLALSLNIELSAEKGSKAEKLGLFTHKYQLDETINLDLYQKKWRLFLAKQKSNGDLNELNFLTHDFYNYLNLTVSSPNAYKNITKKNFWDTLEPIFDTLRISPRQQDLIHFLIKHLNEWQATTTQRASFWFNAFMKKSANAGFDSGDMLDAYLSLILLEKVLGTITFNIKPVIYFHNFTKTLANFHHLGESSQTLREEKSFNIKYQLIKDIFNDINIDLDQLLSELNINNPEPSRKFIESIYQLLMDHELNPKHIFSHEHQHYCDKMELARQNFDERLKYLRK